MFFVFCKKAERRLIRLPVVQELNPRVRISEGKIKEWEVNDLRVKTGEQKLMRVSINVGSAYMADAGLKITVNFDGFLLARLEVMYKMNDGDNGKLQSRPECALRCQW